MDIWLRRAATFDEEEQADTEFWAAMTPDQRVAVVEEMRQQWIEEHGGDEGLRKLFSAFLGKGVRFLVVGAHALAHHANLVTRRTWMFCSNRHERTRTSSLLRWSSAALPASGSGRPTSMNRDAFFNWAFRRNRIDLMTRIDGVTFDEAWDSRVEGTYGGVTVPFIGYEALMKNKLASGRPQDLADLETLKRFRR